MQRECGFGQDTLYIDARFPRDPKRVDFSLTDA
jgi:hypothetical protein